MSAKRPDTSAAPSSTAGSAPAGRPSATTLSAFVTPTTKAASYQTASPIIPCSFPAAVCALTQYSQAFTPLTTAATISFSPRVNSPDAIARFIARPCGPPKCGSQAITRLIAGGSVKSKLNHALDSSKSFCADSGYSEAFLKRTVGIESLLRPANDPAGARVGHPPPVHHDRAVDDH